MRIAPPLEGERQIVCFANANFSSFGMQDASARKIEMGQLKHYPKCVVIENGKGRRMEGEGDAASRERKVRGMGWNGMSMQYCNLI
jgi:hypothetical protein